MSQVFAVFAQAVYRHGCYGVFDTLEAAKQCAMDIARADHDSHHYYEVVPFEINRSGIKVSKYSGDASEVPAVFSVRKCDIPKDPA